MRRIGLFLCLASSVVWAQGPHPAAATSGFTVKKSVVYAQGVHGDLLADLYVPEPKREKMPAVLLIHGGGWLNGTRDAMSPANEDMAAAGFVGMTIEYDLSGSGTVFPTALEECWKAVHWLREHAGEYGVDPQRIAVAGSSAGGELAALMGLGAHRPTDEPAVAAAIVYNGVLDLGDPKVGQKMVTSYLGGSCEEKKVLCREASPNQTVVLTPIPFFVGHGTEDATVPYAQAEQFVDKLRKASAPVTVFTAPGGPHTYWKDRRWAEPNMQASIAFLKQVLK